MLRHHTALPMAALLAVLCSNASASEGEHTSEPIVEPVVEKIDPGQMRHEKGFCYIATPRLRRRGDKGGPPSVCVLMEDGKPLPTPRSIHADIRSKGIGRYSHWTATSLYISASDNSDPRSNGRAYTLVSTRKALRHRYRVAVARPASTVTVSGSPSHEIIPRRLVLRHLDPRTTACITHRVGQWPDLTSVDGMLKSILEPNMTDEQKALAIWQFLADWRHHYYPAEGGNEVHDPVKFINVYGYGFCDDSARNFAGLCRAAGLKARIWGLSGHVVGEAFFGGRWHMLDPDHEAFYRMPGGYIASVEELAAHPELITRTPRDPVGSRSESIAKLYTTTKDNHAQGQPYPTGHRLAMPLGPGDEAVFDCTRPGRAHRVIYRDQAQPPSVGNGRLVRTLHLPPDAAEGTVRVQWPYVILGGRLDLALASPAATVSVSLLAGGQTVPLPAERGAATLTVGLDDWFDQQKRAHYEYALRIASGGGKPLGRCVRSGRLTTVFQFAPLALPRVCHGDTTFLLSARGPGDAALPDDWKGLEIIHEWDEKLDEGP